VALCLWYFFLNAAKNIFSDVLVKMRLNIVFLVALC
jgi:hypothetical protein